MIIEVSREIYKACLTLERYGVSSARDTELSKLIPEFRVIAVKPQGASSDEILVLPLHDIPKRLTGAQLHAELYRRMPNVKSILGVSPEWTTIASGIGRSLDPTTYGYVPSFDNTVPCTTKIPLSKESSGYATVAADAICDVISGTENPRAVLIKHSGAIVFADSPRDAAEFAITLEYAAKKAFYIRKFK